MSQTPAQSSRTELLDSLLHTNVARVIVGGMCGVASGLVMLMITTLFTPPGASKLWWLQVLGSGFSESGFWGHPLFFGGSALAYDVSSVVIVTGLLFHLFLSGFAGLVVGKMTTSTCLGPMAFYGFVLGFLTWLASNMFGPNFTNYLALGDITQCTRLLLFMPFGICLCVFLALASRALKL